MSSPEAGKHVLWGLSGSVAAIRGDRLASMLLPIGAVRAIVTRRAEHFLPELPADILAYRDADEWQTWSVLGDPVLHIELRRWADVLVIAPATADLIAKLAHGMADTLLLSVARAWDFEKPILVAPAMNTYMWEHPATAGHLATLRDWGFGIIDPVSKQLACQDVGMGALADAETIGHAVAAALAGR